MSQRRNKKSLDKKSLVQTALDQVADADQRRVIVERAADAATQAAAEVAKRSVGLGSQISERASDVVQVVSEEGHAFVKEHAASAPKKPKKSKRSRKHRLRKALLLTGTGAVAAYFLDPDNGSQRRTTARRRTSTSAQAVGDGFAVAAHVAHQAADVTAVDPAAP